MGVMLIPIAQPRLSEDAMTAVPNDLRGGRLRGGRPTGSILRPPAIVTRRGVGDRGLVRARHLPWHRRDDDRADRRPADAAQLDVRPPASRYETMTAFVGATGER